MHDDQSLVQELEIEYQIRRLAHHPSIVIWDACNECGAFGLYACFVATTVAGEDPSRPLWPSCPANGWLSGVDRLTSMPSSIELRVSPGSVPPRHIHHPRIACDGVLLLTQPPCHGSVALGLLQHRRCRAPLVRCDPFLRSCPPPTPPHHLVRGLFPSPSRSLPPPSLVSNASLLLSSWMTWCSPFLRFRFSHEYHPSICSAVQHQQHVLSRREPRPVPGRKWVQDV